MKNVGWLINPIDLKQFEELLNILSDDFLLGKEFDM